MARSQLSSKTFHSFVKVSPQALPLVVGNSQRMTVKIQLLENHLKWCCDSYEGFLEVLRVCPYFIHSWHSTKAFLALIRSSHFSERLL